ncbi:MAG: F0F1 ATP synthase subunit B [Endomicrobiales bacterium]
MEILHTFGFDPKIFIGQVVNFLILFFIFKRFLYRPILRVIKEREERIRKGLEDAEKTRVVLDETNRDREVILRTTRAEAQEIIENTRKLAEEMRQELLSKSRAESEKLMAQAKAQAVLEREKMEKQVKVMSLDLSQKVLLSVIGSLFTREEKEKVMKKALEKMEKDGGAGAYE